MIEKKEIPCKDCVCFPICFATMQSVSTKKGNIKGQALQRLLTKCPPLYEYLSQENGKFYPIPKYKKLKFRHTFKIKVHGHD